MSKHRARTLLGSGIFRFTTDQGAAVYLPLKPDLLALVATLHAPPLLPHRRRGRNIVVYAR